MGPAAVLAGGCPPPAPVRCAGLEERAWKEGKAPIPSTDRSLSLRKQSHKHYAFVKYLALGMCGGGG